MNVKRFGSILCALALPLALTVGMVACGGDDDLDPGSADLSGGDDDSTDELDDFADAVNDATGAGGGGMLVFDGQEYPIETATCFLDGPGIDVSAVGGDYLVIASGELEFLDLQILDAEGLQWFDGDGSSPLTGAEVVVDGNTVTGEENSWFNNSDDELVTASFVIECP